MTKLYLPTACISILMLAPYLINCNDKIGDLANNCSNDSLSNGCQDGHESSSFSYNSADGMAFDVPQEYDFDRLSDRDYTVFKSRSPDDWRAADQDTTLRQVLMIHRHGDRTPITFAPKDPLAQEPFWTFHGLGQLTNRGKARLSMLGEIMRMRYDRFFAGSVNKNLRKSRASGSLRCIESADVFLASFLSLNRIGSPDARELFWDRSNNKLSHLWQPASVNTLAAKFDGMLNEGATCKTIDREYELIDNSDENKQLTEEFKAESRVLKEVLDFDTDHFYKWFWGSSFIEVERSYFENKVDLRLLQAYDRIERAGNRALVLYQSTLISRRLRSGLLINDMIGNMQTFRKIAQGDAASNVFNKKFVHYSAHDLNLVVLLGMFDNIDTYPFRPDYASNIILELHQDGDEWFIKLFYMPHVPSKFYELHIGKCEQDHPRGRCALDKFDELMQQYKVDSWQTWMSECNNELSSVDPYLQNT